MLALFCVVVQLKWHHHQSELVPKTWEPHVTMDKLFAAVAQTLLETGETISNAVQLICVQVHQLSLCTGYITMGSIPVGA